jgi:hypothetical protein
MSQQETSGTGAPAASPAAPATLAATSPDGEWEGGAQAGPRRFAALQARPWALQPILLAGYLLAGIAVTMPRATLMTGRLPLTGDQTQYVWSMWWVAHQVSHLSNPYFTSHLAAPVGVQLGPDTLMPLLGVIMMPVTLLFGPTAAYNVLVAIAPGLAAYAMYRAARLWLPGYLGPITAGAFFGLSSMLTSQDWLHIHTAMGCVFLPVMLEAAVRLKRDPTVGRAIIAGIVLGATMLIDQESALLAGILAVLVLGPWLLRKPSRVKLRAAAIGVVSALVVAAPQLLAMVAASGAGGTVLPPTKNYLHYAGEVNSLFSPSPRLSSYKLSWLAAGYGQHTNAELITTFGLILTLLAVLGLIVSWRRSASKRLALLWLGCALLSLGPTLAIGSRQYAPDAATWHGIRVSLIMPYTWLIRVPVLSSFREADRLALLGLVGAALLAGAGLDWLRRHSRRVFAVAVVLAALELGWGGPTGQPTMPASLPQVDRPVAADSSGSIVVDAPFMVRGPERYGEAASPASLVLATADGHPRAISYTSGVQQRTITGIMGHAFYAGLVAAQRGTQITPAQIVAARQDLRSLDVGWVMVWPPRWLQGYIPGTPTGLDYNQIAAYLTDTGFVRNYTANGVVVYRPAPRP